MGRIQDRQQGELQVLRLRWPRIAVSNFAQDDKGWGGLEKKSSGKSKNKS
jgi:hypothetical protein